VAPRGGAYVSESNFFEEDWQHSYWGSNYARLASVKKKYDLAGLFFVHSGVVRAWKATSRSRQSFARSVGTIP
jgi:Berberine and berberine like